MRNYIIAFVVWLVFILPAQSAEVIHSYDSVIDVQPSGLFVVTETIKVRAEGVQIRRGIFRDLPTIITDVDGDKQPVDVKVLSVFRDGVVEPFKVDARNDHKRIYIGDADVFLEAGDYTYQIRYSLNRQLGFFDTHTEVYFNVTGNEWDFPISKATARVNLPNGAQSRGENFFTGRLGSKDQHATAELLNDGRSVYFETNKPLKRGEGLTIAVKFDNGIVKPHQKIQYLTQILSLDRTVKVNEDGTVRVRELFNLAVGTSDWRKGRVSRTFRHESGYPRIKFISVKQNGLPLTFEAERNRNFIYVSWDDRVEHEAEKQYLYEIVYEADDQFKFDGGKATLDVKVAADGFSYPIKKHTFTLDLPKAGAIQTTMSDFGDVTTDNAAIWQVLDDGKKVVFQHPDLKEKKPYLFLHIEMEDSVVAPPSWTKWWNWTWEYFANLILTWAGLAGLALYYLIFWVIKGRDPKAGTVVPRWDILDGMSPAIVNYIENKGLGGSAITAMSAGLVSLAVKGRLVMKDFSKDLTLTYEKGARLDDLPVGETALLTKLADVEELTFDRASHADVIDLRTKFTKAMEKEHRNK